MAAFFQLLRDRIFGRAFIIVPRQHVENTEEQKTSLDAPGRDENADEISKRDNDTGTNSDKSIQYISNKNSKCSVETICDTKKNFEKLNGSSSLNISHVDVMSLYTDIKQSNDLEKRCESVLNLALCLIQDSPDIEYSDLIEALNNLADSHNFPVLAVCHALLLYAFTRMSMSLSELEVLEESILNLTGSLKRKVIVNNPKMYKTSVLVKDHNEIAFKLCQQLFIESYLDLWDIDISTICCSTLYNLSSLIKQHEDELGAKYCFKNSTIKYILGMTGRSTQEIVSEFMITQRQLCPSISSHRVKQCLHVLEHALSVNPSLSNCESLQHENFSLPHCLTRLLGWSVSSVFPNDDKTLSIDSVYYKFHRSTLVCILKVLSVMTFNPHQYDSFTNVKGLMEKILICTLKAYFESESNHFDIQILCLEMLINLYIKNQKTFILLCLKKFKINESEEILAVEALLKMLSDNLEKIKEVKQSTLYPQNIENKSEVTFNISNSNAERDVINEGSNKKPRKENNEEMFEENGNKNSENKSSEDVLNKDAEIKSESVECDPILLAASKDMEHSTIVSFICVLIVFFMKTKQSFKEFILSKLSSQVIKEATDVSRKFLEFASLTGGMPVTGILILTQTINKLQSMQTV